MKKNSNEGELVLLTIKSLFLQVAVIKYMVKENKRIEPRSKPKYIFMRIQYMLMEISEPWEKENI